MPKLLLILLSCAVVGLCQRGVGDQHWGRRQLRGAGADLRNAPGCHRQGQDRPEALGHRQRQLQTDLDGEFMGGASFWSGYFVLSFAALCSECSGASA